MNSDLITYYRNDQNLGLFGNWNRCVELATTKWITFLHSDDMLVENFLTVMFQAITENKSIDQLCCNYKMFDVSNTNAINFKNELCAVHSNKKITRLSEFDYFMYMATSVKGAMMKRDILLDIGGFRNFNDGIGLGDYLAMLKYSHYANTFLLDENLYVDCFGNNESVNTIYWYPDLVSTYFMQIFLIENVKLPKFLTKRFIKINAIEKAKNYNSGKNWLNTKVLIDETEFFDICDIKKNKLNFIDSIYLKLIRKIYRFKRKRNKNYYWFRF